MPAATPIAPASRQLEKHCTGIGCTQPQLIALVIVVIVVVVAVADVDVVAVADVAAVVDVIAPSIAMTLCVCMRYSQTGLYRVQLTNH